jgi:hypothetical protein
MLIVEAEDKAAAQAQADNDPYTAAGVFESVEIHAWRLGPRGQRIWPSCGRGRTTGSGPI